MDRQSGTDLARLIVVIDLFRDQLYEEFLRKNGSQALEILRNIQNG
ncbi:hypothetical protein [Mesobacillus jeotgali]|nr:hypothetical protein [Mesobacillus jeotgali]